MSGYPFHDPMTNPPEWQREAEAIELVYSVTVHQNLHSEDAASPEESDVANWIADGMRANGMDAEYVEVKQQ